MFKGDSMTRERKTGFVAAAFVLVTLSLTFSPGASATAIEPAPKSLSWTKTELIQPASPKNCRRVMWNTYYERAQQTTYRIEKYICRGSQVYGRLIGNPGPVAIAVSLTADYTAWDPWYSIPTGYTPPRTSITTNVVNAGNLAAATYVCLRTYTGFMWGCLNERDGYANGPLPR